MILLVFFSALLLFLSFPNYFNAYGFHFLAWGFAIPLFYALEKAKLFRRITYGTIFGLLFYSLLIAWFRPYSDPGYVFFILVLCSQPLLFSVFYFPRQTKEIWHLFYPAALWVSTEYLRKTFLSGFSWDLGHSQAFDLAAVQIAGLFGSSGISFIIIFFNQCGYRFLKGKEGRKPLIVAMLLVLGGVYGYGFWELQKNPQNSDKSVNILALQPNINYQEKLDEKNVERLFQKQLALTQKALQDIHPDLIIWPETAVPTDVLDDENLRQQIEDLARSSRSELLIGTAINEGRRDYNSAILFTSDGQMAGSYHKRRLVPFTEYLPFGKVGEILQKLLKVNHYDFTAGEKAELFELRTHGSSQEKITFGMLICSEDTIAQLFRQYARKKAQFVVVLLNDGWFADKKALILHAQNTLMHAVENRLPVLRVANTGWSCYIDAHGRVRPELGRDPSKFFNQEMALEFSVSPHQELTLANRLGDSFSLFCLCFVISTLVVRFFKRANYA